MENIVTEKKCSKCSETKPVDKFPKIGARCKACLYKYQKEWTSRNRDKVREIGRRHDRKRTEYIKTRTKARYAADPVGIREAIKKWRRENPEQRRESSRLWRERNRDKVSEYNRRQREKFPDKVRLNNEKRRARERGADGTITAKEWKDLLDRYDYKCLCCGKTGIKLTLDHIMPLAMGGNHTIDNAQCLCSSCNSKKGVRYIDYR